MFFRLLEMIAGRIVSAVFPFPFVRDVPSIGLLPEEDASPQAFKRRSGRQYRTVNQQKRFSFVGLLNSNYCTVLYYQWVVVIFLVRYELLYFLLLPAFTVFFEYYKMVGTYIIRCPPTVEYKKIITTVLRGLRATSKKGRVRRETAAPVTLRACTYHYYGRASKLPYDTVRSNTNSRYEHTVDK